MQIYLPPERRLEAAPATPTTATPIAATAVVEAAVATAPRGEDARLDTGVKTHPASGSCHPLQSTGKVVVQESLKTN
jgi:hypothetical protein